ncbi:MAG: CotH kinase family protein, partial [Bacteroidales bacterium]|nr:CotH kinase family protein [Bacteroidales bacterium]
MRKFLFSVFAGGFIFANAQPVEIFGTVIGTAACFDYQTNTMSTTANTAANLFDNDLHTYFATNQRSGGWAGLDFGKKHVITRVEYGASDLPERLLLGIFEGGNLADFSDAIPLLLVTDREIQPFQFGGQDVTCSRGFRYVRFIGPNDSRCKISELKFFGYESDGDDSNLYQLTNLPTVIIHTIDAQPVTSKEVYIKGAVSIISDNGTNFFSSNIDIRGRGNMSWTHPKKPYRMKLAQKASPLGLPATERNWTLINNYGDKTLMRNLLAFDLSRKMEMPYTPAGVAVDVILNGEYQGTYQLCDHIEVATARVNIDKMKASDTSLPALSGGYFLEIDAYADTEPVKFYTSRWNIPVVIKSPDDDVIVDAQKEYIKNHFENMLTALASFDYKNPNTGYRKYMDMQTVVRQFLIGEIS